MSKTITITVVDSEKSHEPEVFNLEYDTETPTLEEWEVILQFEDDHVGGRPKDR